MASETQVEAPQRSVDRRRIVRYALGSVAGAVALPVLAACGGKPKAINSSSTSASSSSTPLPAALPQSTKPTWPLNVAISQVKVAGSMYAVSGSKVEMAAFGNDMWNNACNFGFYGEQVSGTGTWSVEVAYLANTNAWAKAGLVIMQSLDPTDVFIDLVVTPSNGVNAQYRLFKGKYCPTATGANGPDIDSTGAAPIYLQMQKTAKALIVSDSTDGVTWKNTATLTFTAPDSTTNLFPKGVQGATSAPPIKDPFYVGICACSHDAKLRGLAGFDHVTGLKNPQYHSIYDTSATYNW